MHWIWPNIAGAFSGLPSEVLVSDTASVLVMDSYREV